jgi:membrane protease YdiL (CAAX protease family)
MAFLGINVLLVATAAAPLEYEISAEVALAYAVFSVSLASMAWFIIQLPGLREWFAHRLIRGAGKYDAYNGVHTVALVSALFMLVYTAANFVLLGGIAGIADALAKDTIQPVEMIASTLRFLAVALIGVGFVLRRDVIGTARRLKLRLPTQQDVVWGLVGGVGAFILMYIFSAVWSAVAPPEQISQIDDATSQTMMVFGQTLLGGLLFALLTGLGEEILFRGALQPVFGLWWTSLFFALVHVQYWLTPAMLVIFVVALLFGWVCHRASTTAAIIAHVVYNFLPFLLIFLLSNQA